MIYIKDQDEHDKEMLRTMEYATYRSVCPEKIIDFFEKHLEF